MNAFSRDAPPTVGVSITVNGDAHELDLDPRVSLLDLLRLHLGLTSSKKGCDQGACGACTVLLDGERANACLVLSVRVDGQEVTTVEGIGMPDRLHPLQDAFIEHDGFQCGYCTPGQIVSGVALMEEAVLDPHFHRYANDTLAEYHVLTNRDAPDIEAHFVGEPDTVLDPLGARGVGEIATVGTSSAIINALFPAEG